MTLTKSLLLGSAAALFAAAGANAADLPSKKAAPAQYVKICSAAGDGYFYIPGSDTCLKVSGYAEFDFLARTTKATYSSVTGAVSATAKSRNNYTNSIDSEIQLDAITKTSWGDLHTYIAFEMENGVAGSADPTFVGSDGAYIEFAGLTAGRHESFFHNIGGLYSGYQTPDYKSNMLAYTASFGGGFSATISLEDAAQGRVGVAGGTYNGTRAPDVVGALRVKQGWGEASLIGGFHQTPYNNGAADVNATGYAVMGYVSVNLPMLAAGDSIALQGAWERNAIAFSGLSNANKNSYNGYQGTVADVYYGPTSGLLSSQHNQTGYTILGYLKHNWTPTVSTEIEASYGALKYSNLGTTSSLTVNSYNAWMVGQVTKWTPVKGLEFGIDTAYTRYKNKWNPAQVLAVPTVSASQSDFRVQFRAVRSF